MKQNSKELKNKISVANLKQKTYKGAYFYLPDHNSLIEVDGDYYHAVIQRFMKAKIDTNTETFMVDKKKMSGLNAWWWLPSFENMGE